MAQRRLRRLRSDDYNALMELWADAGLPYRPFGRDSHDNMAVEMLRLESGFFGIFEDRRLIAAGLATWDGRKGWLNRVAVHPDFRRQGLATEIIRACERFLRDMGAEIIACLIEDYNTPSMALFQKEGYLYGEDINYFSKRKSDDT
jgi:N-acetylglutamate synthase